MADELCDIAILTEEDPYDEDPQKIIEELAAGFSARRPRVIPDRRAAIAAAIKEAKDQDDAVLITGKGTDPYIMGPKGSKAPWSDAKVVEEELIKLGYN